MLSILDPFFLEKRNEIKVHRRWPLTWGLGDYDHWVMLSISYPFFLQKRHEIKVHLRWPFTWGLGLNFSSTDDHWAINWVFWIILKPGLKRCILIYCQTSLTMCLFFHYRSEWEARYKRAASWQRDEWHRLWKKREKAIKNYLNAKALDFLLIRNVANGLISRKEQIVKCTSNGHVMDN